MRKFAFKSAFLLLVSLFAFSLVTRNAVAATVVSPANMNGWAFQVQSPDGSGTFVTGPATAPVGTGSARLFTGTNGNLFTALHSSSHVNTNLSNVTRLEFSTYSTVENNGDLSVPYVVLDVSTGIGPDVLTYDPNEQTQNTQAGVWQTWDAPNGFWRSSSFSGGFTGGTLSQYISFINGFSSQDITFVNRGDGSGGLRFHVGPASSSDVFDGNVDNFTIGVSGSDTTYDFEPTVATNNYQQTFFNGNFGAPIGTETTYTPPVVPNAGGFSWGMGSPGAGVPADNFSARWSGTFDFDAAIYRFIANTNNKNDTIRVYVDDVLKVERTPTTITPLPPAPFVFDPTKNMVMHGALIPMTDGVHEVTIELVHTTGSSAPRFSFWKPADCRDLTADGIVNSGDQGVQAKFYGVFPSFVDQNGDNVTNSGDQAWTASKYGKTCPYI